MIAAIKRVGKVNVGHTIRPISWEQQKHVLLKSLSFNLLLGGVEKFQEEVDQLSHQLDEELVTDARILAVERLRGLICHVSGIGLITIRAELLEEVIPDEHCDLRVKVVFGLLCCHDFPRDRILLLSNIPKIWILSSSLDERLEQLGYDISPKQIAVEKHAPWIQNLMAMVDELVDDAGEMISRPNVSFPLANEIKAPGRPKHAKRKTALPKDFVRHKHRHLLKDITRRHYRCDEGTLRGEASKKNHFRWHYTMYMRATGQQSKLSLMYIGPGLSFRKHNCTPSVFNFNVIYRAQAQVLLLANELKKKWLLFLGVQNFCVKKQSDKDNLRRIDYISLKKNKIKPSVRNTVSSIKNNLIFSPIGNGQRFGNQCRLNFFSSSFSKSKAFSIFLKL
ncbi:hypothetical protein PHYBLDRAFT_67332 [Phycomyces blakesleeanus NRRL 1555(-)]|uniref:Uncharacterized protein n=1 Tax=Phycomyces blakesleeanus (strain ATCC 8743b / DSM 1359 / FGSC 10004 / NBRC 33097 / NRRL 1555) TaxID=763407 RepID=A0A167K3F2_PHYB8|nr:hypothetical protein PHYBLDRAFT_67332 [Phycomyces blakesleeanus NRRL 1555(-)]OAD67196.1 hypothetical protein PHYBLDRAFT_67332 [Phycomyces blakesleeanus NRRL 1555(-)]|eukprot:XP_018285236.1 hypothetical protein PHYBLDRAFT_67332 [Phycomyces blakesleeanus NRRL 1555(-)]